MRILWRTIGGLSLVLLTAPSVVYLAGRMSLETVKGLMLIATILWFVSSGLAFLKSSKG
ncbi:MAG: hypothetical protein GX298_10680 [Planctomycetes bacterium]|jgi:hypothetical protein|nr:hypothetical protein [Planctomycetota bacterium]